MLFQPRFRLPTRSSQSRWTRHTSILTLVCLALLTACHNPLPAQTDSQAEAQPAFNPAPLAAIDLAISQSISRSNLPGGVLWLEHGNLRHVKAYGSRALMPAPEPMTTHTVFDAASLTKVIATAPSILLLIERGKLKLDQPVKSYLPEFSSEGSAAITLRHLLTHTSGLRPGLSSSPPWSGYSNGIARACAEKVQTPPGTAFKYSDINFILLGEIVSRVSGLRLDAFAQTNLFQPLGMRHTGFLPPQSLRDQIAPTTEGENGFIRGVVHDPTSRRMGGVTGHAGLFTTAPDLARFARMMLQDGELDGVRIFKPETVRLAVTVQSPTKVTARRGLGWDIDSPYAGPRGQLFPVGSYGHTGWTGTSIWIDPYSQSFVLFLSNRNHPTEAGNVITLRKELGTLGARAIPDFNFNNIPGALQPYGAPQPPEASQRPRVLNGVDVLVKQQFAPLKKLRIGLITNHTGRDHRGRATIDLLQEAPEVELKALFSPEHGLRGILDAKVNDQKDEKTGLPVYSLYGERRAPTPEQLQGLDALVFDIQDIGCRFYTYVSTMGLCMEAAGRAGLKFVVLDRVNPINGVDIEGPVYGGPSHFVAFHRLPVRHGMTLGELARMFNEERSWRVNLTVIPLEGWSRSMWFDETGLPWTNPSPNMRNLTEATLYPGIGLLESALSVGRGTDTPFEVMGAPYIDAVHFANALNEASLPGVHFVPIDFTPKAGPFQGQHCGGVYMMPTDRGQCPVVAIGIVAALHLKRHYPTEFALEKMETLLGDPTTIRSIRERRSFVEIQQAWAAGLAEFGKRRAPFLLYP